VAAAVSGSSPSPRSIGQYLHQVSRIAATGRLEYSEWETDNGKRSKQEIVLDQVEFLDPKPVDEPVQSDTLA
jgi:single-stranded DNA-binding protein